ncbi:unnamed protein product, partial [Allacma fusca]
LAEMPYPGAVWNQDFLESLENGYRLDRPKFASTGIFEYIKSCWRLEPELRPSFAKLKEYFSNPNIHRLASDEQPKAHNLPQVYENQQVV